MATMKNHARRKNRKIKFSEEFYVENNYINKDGKAVIPIELKNIDDLYMKHDYRKLELSDEICDYIEEIAYIIPINVDIILEIHCPRISLEEMNQIVKCIHNNYGMEIDDVEYDIAELNKKSLFLALFGIILLVFNIILDKYIGDIASNFLSVVWWIGIWDSIEIQLLDKTNNRWKRLNYQQLYDCETVFIFEDDK